MGNVECGMCGFTVGLLAGQALSAPTSSAAGSGDVPAMDLQVGELLEF